jgi:hypothetical protein
MTQHQTGDFGLIAYLVLIKGLATVNELTRKIGRGKMIYVFEMTEDDWVKARLEYCNSIFPKFLAEMKLRQDPSY